MCEDCFGTLNGCTYGASSQKQLTACFASNQKDALHLAAGRKRRDLLFGPSLGCPNLTSDALIVCCARLLQHEPRHKLGWWTMGSGSAHLP